MRFRVRAKAPHHEINEMKPHPGEEKFWRVIENLFIAGLEKGNIGT
jgi:hypothetical protein